MSKDYADMLKPIRDLAKNWDINIASCLEDYIQDLEKITVNVDVDGVKSQMNFAQAALLIQGSSAVYARKVEYLHSLVYKTLEALTEKKNKKSKDGENAGDTDDISGFDIEMNFLLLDDHITTGSRYNIDLIEEEDDKLNPGMDRSQSTQGDYYDDDIELNKQNLMNNRRLSNISNISRGSQALMNSLVGDIGQNGLRLMSSEVDITGALMLPGSRAFDIANGGNGDQSEFILQDDEQMMMNDDDEMINVQDNEQEEVAEESVEEPSDPWAMLDPNDAGHVKARPLKKKATFKLPASLTGEEEEEDDVNTSMNLSTTLAANSSMLNNQSSVLMDNDGLTFRGLAYGKEFNYILKDQTKKNNRSRRKGKRVHYQQEEEEEEEEFMIDEQEFQQQEVGDQIMMDQQNVDEQQFETQFGHSHKDGVENDNINNPMNETRYEEKFEMLCRQHLQSFSRAAERYAAETHLSKRVSGWNNRLVPVLEQEENREEFNIQATSEKILQTVASEIKKEEKKMGKGKKNTEVDVASKTVDFKLVSDGQPNYEVCRMFLSSLLLANEGNVALEHPESDDNIECNNLVMKMLDEEMKHVTMEEVL